MHFLTNSARIKQLVPAKEDSGPEHLIMRREQRFKKGRKA